VRVALTFDAEYPDQPGGNSTNAWRILERLGPRAATFFIQGRWARSEPELAWDIASRHLIGNHSNWHVRMTYLSEEGLTKDIIEAQETILRATGVDPRPWYRCPSADGHGDPRIKGILAELGYRAVLWHLAVEDWEPSRSAGQIAEDVVYGALAYGDGAVVLLHTWPEHTVEALPGILRGLEGAGCTFVRIDELGELP
jgi:peptidoglycan-N-acetylglucosamine deacetylase